MNSHAEVQKRLSAYCGGDMEPAERQLVEQHLAACPPCRAELGDLQTALRLLRTTAEVDPPPWLTARIMANIREQQAEKRSWLQRIFLPLHIKLPLEAIALVMVCVSGYYLSRTVETDLQSTGRQQLQEIPAQQAPLPSQAPVQPPAGSEKAPPSAATPPQGAVPPPAAPQQIRRQEYLPARKPPQTQTAPAPTTYAPAPPAYRDQDGGKAETMKAAPEMKLKSSRSPEHGSDAAAPAAAGRAVGAPAGSILPQAVVRLSVDDSSAAPAMIRETVLRSGGTVVDERELTGRRLRVRIPAVRQHELLDRLERLGRIMARPDLPSGAELLELTIQW